MYVDNEKTKKTKPQVKKFLKKRKKDSTFTFGEGSDLIKKLESFKVQTLFATFQCFVT